MNIVEILKQSAEKYDAKTAFIQNNKTISYRELYRRANQLAYYLKSKGIKKDDNILVFIPLSIDLYLAMIAIWTLGAKAIFIDFSRGNNFINASIERIRPELVLCDHITYFMRFFLGNVSKLKAVNICLLKNKNIAKAELAICPIAKEDGAILSFTSGTTNQPKIALRSHQFLIHQYESLIKEIDYNERHIDLGTLPIFSLVNLAVGITTVLPNRRYKSQINIKALVKSINRYKVTRAICSPALMEELLKLDKLTSIEQIYLGGAAVFPSLLNAIDKKKQLYIVYGSTEAEPIAKLNWHNLSINELEKMRTIYALPVGEIAEDIKCKIIDDEIIVTGKTVLKSYLNGIGDKENKMEIDGEIWHRTGDAGFIDENGMLWLLGRHSHKVDGIYPFQVETMLDIHFGIKSAFLEYKEEKVVVIEESANINKADILSKLEFFGIKKVITINKIPRDKRHNAKVDVNRLKAKLDKME